MTELKSEASPFRDTLQKLWDDFREGKILRHRLMDTDKANLEFLEYVARMAVEATQTYWRTCDCEECRESENDPDVLQGIAELMSTLAEKEREHGT